MIGHAVDTGESPIVWPEINVPLDSATPLNVTHANVRVAPEPNEPEENTLPALAVDKARFDNTNDVVPIPAPPMSNMDADDVNQLEWDMVNVLPAMVPPPIPGVDDDDHMELVADVGDVTHLIKMLVVSTTALDDNETRVAAWAYVPSNPTSINFIAPLEKCVDPLDAGDTSTAMAPLPTYPLFSI